MNTIQILLHLGSIIRTIEDGEKTIGDLTHHAPAGTDAIKTLEDVVSLIAVGVVPLPAGLTIEMIRSAFDELKGVLPQKTA